MSRNRRIKTDDAQSFAASLSSDEIAARLDAAESRPAERLERITFEDRPPTARETALNDQDRAEAEQLRQALPVRQAAEQLHAHNDAQALPADLETLVRQIFEFIPEGQRAATLAELERTNWAARRPAPESQMAQPVVALPLENRPQFAELVGLVSTGQTGRVVFAVSTATAGGGATVGGSQPTNPLFITDQMGFPVLPAEDASIQVPTWAALNPGAATAEGGAVPALADPTLTTAPMAAFVHKQSLTAQAAKWAQGLARTVSRLEAQAIADVNKAATTTIQTAAGAALAYATSIGAMLNRGYATVAAATGQGPVGLLVNSADFDGVASFAATSADDVAKPVLYVKGARLIVNDAVTAGQVVYVAASGFEVHRTNFETLTGPDVSTNSQAVAGVIYASLAPNFVGASVAVDISA